MADSIRSVKKYYAMMPLFDELIKSQQQALNFLQESGVNHKELEQKQKFLTAVKECMQVAHDAIIDLMSALSRKDAMEDLFFSEMIRQRDYHAAWEYFWMNKALQCPLCLRRSRKHQHKLKVA